MKVGQVYKGKKKNILYIPLSEPDLDGNVLQLLVELGSPKRINNVNQSVFDIGTVTTTKQALDANTPQFAFSYAQLGDVDSTYVPSTELALSIGDKYQYIGKPAEYTVLTFFDRLKTANATSKIPYPFGVNLADVIAFVDGIINSKTGITPYLVGYGNLMDDFSARLKSILLGNNNVNAELAYWSISEPKLAKVLYLKQSKPKKSITLQVKQKTKVTTVTAGDIIVDSLIVDDTDTQKQNFKTYTVTPRSNSLLLDKFRFTTGKFRDYASRRTYAKSTVLYLVSVQKLFDNAGVISGLIPLEDISNEVNTNLYGKAILFGTSDLMQVYDVDRYAELTSNKQGEGTPYKIGTYNSLDFHGDKPIILNPAMMYLGGGYFSDAQAGKGKYGVGDEFEIFNNDEIIYSGNRDTEWTILFSKFITNKKAELEIVYRCINMTYLRQACDTYNFSKPYDSNQQYQYFEILESTLDAKFAGGTYGNFKSYREDREVIANAYLQGSLSNTPQPSTPQIDEFAELKAILGDDFDNDFLAVVSGLDWGKIDKLRQKDPESLNAIKDLVQQIYVEYLLEKDFTVEPKVVKNTDGVKTKAFYRGKDDVIKERLKIFYDEKFADDTNALSIYDPIFPSLNYQEFGDFFYNVVGAADLSTELLYTGDSGDGDLVISKGIEPAINIQMLWNRYGSDGDVKLEAFGQSFGYSLTKGAESSSQFKWGNVKNYPLKYYAAWAMINVATYLDDGEDTVRNLFGGSNAKAKRALPFKTTPYWLTQLRYFNSLGLFPTIEDAVNLISEIQQIPVEQLSQTNHGVVYFLDGNTDLAKNMFYSASKSVANSNEKFNSVRYSSFLNRTLFQNDAQVFKENLAKVDVDWGNPNAVYEPFTIGTPQVVKPKKTRQPKKPKLKFDGWQASPTTFKELIDEAYDSNGQLWFNYFEKEGERYAFINFINISTTTGKSYREMYNDLGYLVTTVLNFLVQSEELIEEFQDDFSKQEIALYEKINYPLGNIVVRMAMKVNPDGQQFINEFRKLCQERIEANKKAVVPEVPKDFTQWVKSASFAIKPDGLGYQLTLAYETDGIDLYNTRFTYKGDTYTYFSLFYQPQLVSAGTQLNANKDLQAYAMMQGYSQGSTTWITEYQEIFSDELEKGANALNRNTDLRGVVVAVGEENRFIDIYYDYLKAQVAQRVVPPTPTTPTTPEPPKPKVKKPVKPTTPEPPKPKVKKPVKPPVTKVEKLSKKYEDFDLDF
jgi:hypothetical protein